MTGPNPKEGEGSGSKHDNIDYDDPLYTHPSDNSVISITHVKLTGNENYRLWRSSMIRSLVARSAIKLAMNPVFHDKTKHFEIDLHFIREKIDKGAINLVKIESIHNTADVLTKSLVSSQHEYLVSRLILFDPFSKKET